ncbi:hypothetical protein QWY16_09365 [Planococcus shenhongbingii]|uniref:hypothetical protein n=1 Tax=Planococcus shenhongbingii TaxID=3058398 RepID=UPI002610187C|nr:hypothetical protein [Planococcus sp. N016]WKA60292.1 hypothetical protein QWY16_09365 [Planococcus sp. N016]
MENKRVEFSKGMDSKVKEMAGALVAVQEMFEVLKDVKASGSEAVFQLQAKKDQLKEEMQLATDIGSAKYIMQEVEQTEKDIELQIAVNNGQATKIVMDLKDAFTTFFNAHAKAKTVFNALDQEYVQTMSIRSLQDDTTKLNSLASNINGAFGLAKSLLLDVGLAENSTVRYGNTHLGQSNLISKGIGMKREMAYLRKQLSI